MQVKSNKKKSGKKVNYYKNAYLTYNTTTLCANELIFNVKDFSFEAKGGFLIENSSDRHQGNRLTGNFERVRFFV
ncbi:MAG: hypothetical protein ACR2LT_07185 [Pyrinomonadaceae bacterium]